ncbi:MAG: metallophosphoesterase [Treponema sp.]|nr:metallophosphoesterase [Treponema sp.]
MKNTDKKTFNLGLIAIAVCALAFIWFSCRPGLMGTLHWHVGIFFAYIMLLLTALLPLIFLLINIIKTNKATKILTCIFSIFSMSLWIIIYVALMILPRLPLDNSGIKLLYQNDPLPASSSSADKDLLAHYAFASDPHWGSGNSNAQARTEILKQIDSRNYDAFFCLGDVSEVGMIPPIMQGALDDMKANLKNTKTLVIPGNHDFIVNGGPTFRKAFMQKGDKLYFRMDNGSIHMLFLFMVWDDVEFSKTQEKWLIKQLEEIPQEDTVIVISHCYVTGSGYYDSSAKKNWGDIPGVIDTICPILEKYGVDLHLSGHNHFFEFLEKDAVDYLILGGMGGKLDKDLIYTSPYSKWIDNDNFGWVDMKVYKNNIELTIYKYDGSILKTKSIATY